MRAPTKPAELFGNIDDVRKAVSDDFVRACELLYFINPRSNVDPETGQRTGEEGLMRVKLYPEQRIMAAAMLDMQREGKPVRILKLKCRQSGDSTMAALWTFHQIYWKQRQRGILIGHHESTTTALYNMYQTLYNELPDELRWAQRRYNRKELGFEPPSGSSLIAQTAGYLDIGHGLTIKAAHFSEIDRWPDVEVALEGLWETIPFTADTSIIIESVCQGADGWLHNYWRESKKGLTGFLPLFTPAYKIPEYRLPVPKDFARTKEEEQWVQEYGCSNAFLVWRRHKLHEMIAKEAWGGERTMKRMYPFNDEECFQSSGFCVFPDTVLAEQREQVVGPKHVVHLRPIGPGEFHAEKAEWINNTLAIWKDPEPGRFYSLGVDVSDGVAQTESVISICAYPGYEQVAEWASKTSSVEETAWVARWLAQKYGGQNCLVVPEVNKSGVLVVHLLQNLPGEYGIYRWTYFDKAGLYSSDNPKLGWETNDSTKKILVQVANLLFLGGQGIVRSEFLYEQMTRCVDVLPGLRWRVEGKGSDRVLAWLIAMIGAFVEFQGGNLDTMKSPLERASGHGPRRERNSYDADYEDDFHDIPRMAGGGYIRSDYE